MQANIRINVPICNKFVFLGLMYRSFFATIFRKTVFEKNIKEKFYSF